MNLVYVLAYMVLWPVFRILLPTKAVNKHNLPDRGALYCANHTRLNDPLFVAFALGLSRQVHVMAKDEVMHWPVLGWILKKGGIFGVKRGKSDVTAIRTALTYLNNAGRTDRGAHRSHLYPGGKALVPVYTGGLWGTLLPEGSGAQGHLGGIPGHCRGLDGPH